MARETLSIAADLRPTSVTDSKGSSERIPDLDPDLRRRLAAVRAAGTASPRVALGNEFVVFLSSWRVATKTAYSAVQLFNCLFRISNESIEHQEHA